ncbi:MAG: M2 family metallopeptidase [Planctomycetota bacterium]|jgi:peptidyl-dipeptidase A
MRKSTIVNRRSATVAVVLLAGGVARGEPGDGVPHERTLADAEHEFVDLHNAYLERFKPLQRESARTWWEASITGSDEDFQRLKVAKAALVDLHGDRATFAKVTSLRKSGGLRNPVLKRQLEVMYYAFLPRQADPDLLKRIVATEADVEQIFNTHRSLVDRRPRTENDVRKTLARTTASSDAEKAWKGYMAVGGKTAPKLAELVSLRNQAARQIGFKNFFALRIALQEIDEAELFKLFDELEVLTRQPFAQLKRDIDESMARRFGISTDELRPWHFGDLFFQEAPRLGEVDLDDMLQGCDLVRIAEDYFAGMGMPVDDILRRSDLYEKGGKSPHAFSTDIDRAGDVRILCNLKPNMYWTDTLLHELGHAVYSKYLADDLPFDLRKASDGVTTEGIALMLGAMVKSDEWIRKVLNLSSDQAERFVPTARDSLRAEKLIFSRWAQVMTRFEHGMYTNPEQNLGRLWWDLKKRYQLLNPPHDVDRPDYAAKMHVVGSPAYYHSYMMGELFASQVHHYVATQVLGINDARDTCFVGRRKVGDYLRDKIFAPGKLHSWRELTRLATGEPLSAKYFAQQLID